MVEASLSLLLCEGLSNWEQRKRQVSFRAKNTGASERRGEDWKRDGWTYSLDLLRHHLENLSPQVKVDPLRVAVHHLRHLGNVERTVLLRIFHNDARKC